MIFGMHWIDWSVVICMLTGLSTVAWLCRRYNKGVAGFLVAGRGAGRYLGVSSASISGLGGVSILATWQAYYKAGPTMLWWTLPLFTLPLLILMTGFGTYRLRQSRVMTIPQLLEMRYSKSLRIFCGILAYLGGMINMGIFPAVAAVFFVYFCGFPPEVNFWGVQLQTTTCIIFIIVGISALIAIVGGQTTIIITDFLQSVIANFLLIGIVIVLYKTISWNQAVQAFQGTANSEALLNPYHFKGASEFNIVYFMICTFFNVYITCVWAPTASQASSAKNAHESLMMRILSTFREFGVFLAVALIPLAAYVLMHHSDFSASALKVQNILSTVDSEQIRSQMVIPAAFRLLLPVGVIGTFTVIVLFGTIGTHDSYLLSWTSVLIQDIIIPIIGKPLTPKQHVFILRVGIALGGIFISVFSILFRQNDNISMFLAISGAIFFSGSGVAIIAAQYWTRATKEGAWTAAIVGAVLSILYIVCKTIDKDFMLNGTLATFFITMLCIVLFIVVSLLTKDPSFDLDTMLNRRPNEKSKSFIQTHWQEFKKEFSRIDKMIFAGVLVYVLSALSLVGIISIMSVWRPPSTEFWIDFWLYLLIVKFVVGVLIVIWFAWGGIRDSFRLINQLKTCNIDVSDDGSVEGVKAAGSTTEEELVLQRKV
ncbi:MAG: hypothetical protein A2Y10_17380 [Planctomycetes bacterium GWF2_41_51]|nr:MAG: hypothetical protein A2Y10_17380 [Planctomycetes bacterium GWF2_41_51]HBG27999.1 hypothetical protein [Phycisphaerales bacterium]